MSLQPLHDVLARTYASEDAEDGDFEEIVDATLPDWKKLKDELEKDSERDEFVRTFHLNFVSISSETVPMSIGSTSTPAHARRRRQTNASAGKETRHS